LAMTAQVYQPEHVRLMLEVLACWLAQAGPSVFVQVPAGKNVNTRDDMPVVVPILLAIIWDRFPSVPESVTLEGCVGSLVTKVFRGYLQKRTQCPMSISSLSP